MRPTPARAPGSAFPLEIFSLGHQVSRAPRRFWSTGLAASLGRGRTARTPGIPSRSGEPRGARTGFRVRAEGTRTGGLSLSRVSGARSPAKLQGCHSRAQLSAYLPGPHAAPDGARRTFRPSARGRAALVARNPRTETRSPRYRLARAGIPNASSRAGPRRAQRIGAAPCGGDGLGRALRGRRAASGSQQGAELGRL